MVRAVAVTLGKVVVMMKQVLVTVAGVAEAKTADAAAAAAATTALLSIHANVLSAANLAVKMTKKSISLIKRLHFHVHCISSASFCSGWPTSLFAESNSYQLVWPPQSAISI